MRLWPVFVVFAICACGPKSVTTTKPLPSSTILMSGMATRYNDPPGESPPRELSSAILTALREEATARKLRAPSSDARLFGACAALAAVVPEQGVIEYEAVEFALQSHGIIEPSPHLLVVWGSLDKPAGIVEALRPQLGMLTELPNARVGVGAVRRKPDGTGAVVLAVQESRLKTSPIPRTLPAGGNARFEVRLDPGFGNTSVAVLRPNGEDEALDLEWSGSDSFSAQISCSSTVGKLQVQFVASTVDGNSTLASFPIWCGADPPRTMAVGPRRDVLPNDPREAERQLLTLINDERGRLGHAPLQWDESLASVARGHSQDMHRENNVAFVLHGAPSFLERLDGLGPGTRATVKGNIARAYGITETHRGLMDQPMTRSVLMSAKATHMGIGVAYGTHIGSGTREMFVTEYVRLAP